MINSFSTTKLPSILSWLQDLRCDERRMIIIASSRLDELLRRLLQGVMIHQPEWKDELFGVDRPLGTFSSRIHLSYRLGLIDRNYEKFLQQIRKLQIDAAHAAKIIDLSSSPHIDHIANLQSLASTAPMWDTLAVRPIDSKQDPQRSLFLSLIIGVLAAESALFFSKPFQVKTPCGFHLVAASPRKTK